MESVLKSVVLSEKQNFLFFRNYGVTSNLDRDLEVSFRGGLRLNYSDGEPILDFKNNVRKPLFGTKQIRIENHVLSIFPIKISLNVDSEIVIDAPTRKDDKNFYKVVLNNHQDAEISEHTEGLFNTLTTYTLTFNSNNEYDASRFVFSLCCLFNLLNITD